MITLTFVNPRLTCITCHQPISSLHGAHSSHPTAYGIKKAVIPSLALSMPKCLLSGDTALESTAALKFMETWQKATTVRRVHFFLADQACAVCRREFCSLSSLGLGGVGCRSGKCGTGVVGVQMLRVVLRVERRCGREGRVESMLKVVTVCWYCCVWVVLVVKLKCIRSCM
jgi:hypothetical protein